MRGFVVTWNGWPLAKVTGVDAGSGLSNPLLD
jgi:hypothetical protein